MNVPSDTSESKVSIADLKAAKERAITRGATGDEVAIIHDEFQATKAEGESRYSRFIERLDALCPIDQSKRIAVDLKAQLNASAPDTKRRAEIEMLMRQREALVMAAKGWRVFPCEPNGKRPWPGCEWKQEATTDETAIRAWFRDRPGMNYGVAPGPGQFVLDLDCKGNKNGRDDLTQLETANGDLPATLTVKTPSGGEHIYLQGDAPSSVKKKSLGQAIDVRGGMAGHQGYVVGPGSTIDGKAYAITDGREIAAAPGWLLEMTAQTTVEPAKRDPNVALDTPAEVSHVRDYLAKCVEQGDVAIEGCGGNDRTYKLFCLILDHVSESVAFDLVSEIWNPACAPSWGDDELRTIMGNAIEYRQNEIGAKALPPVAELFKEALASIKDEPKTEADDGLIRCVDASELLTHEPKPLQEIIPGLVEKGIATMLAGAGSTHKSRTVLHWCAAIHTGTPIYGRKVIPATSIYLDYENGEDEMCRRLHMIQKRLSLPSLRGFKIFDLKAHTSPLANVTPDGITETKWTDWLGNYLCKIKGHKFIAADSCYNILRFTGQSKIDETLVKEAINFLDNFCKKTDSSMVFLWHPSYSGQDRGDASGWSVAWHNAPRGRDSLTKAKTAKGRVIPNTFTLKVEKRNNGQEGEEIPLYWANGLLLPKSQIEIEQTKSLKLEACIHMAIKAAASDAPIKRKGDIEQWRLDEIERECGEKLNARDIKAELAHALELKRLRYVPGGGHRTAGYYAWDDPKVDPQTRRLDDLIQADAGENGASVVGENNLGPNPFATQ